MKKALKHAFTRLTVMTLILMIGVLLSGYGLVMAEIVSVNLFKKSSSTSVVPINNYTIGTASNPVAIFLSTSTSATIAANVLPAQSSSTSNNFLTSNGSSASWGSIPSAGALSYYMNYATSSVTGFKQMIYTPTSTVNTIASSSLANGGLITKFITPTSTPSLSFIPAGRFETHIHASSTGITSMIYAEIWEVTSTGTDITKIGTSNTSANLATTTSENQLYFTTSNTYTMASTSSRLALKVYRAGTGTSTVTLFLGGTTDSHIHVPMDLSTLVPYSGATQNVDLGTNTITSNGATLSRVNHPFQWTIEYASTSENSNIFIFNATSTINKIVAVNKTAGDTITFNLGYSSSRATATGSLNKLFSSNQTVTSTTTPTVLTINASSTPNTGDSLIFFTSAASSTEFTLTGYYSEN